MAYQITKLSYVTPYRLIRSIYTKTFMILSTLFIELLHISDDNQIYLPKKEIMWFKPGLNQTKLM